MNSGLLSIVTILLYLLNLLKAESYVGETHISEVLGDIFVMYLYIGLGPIVEIISAKLTDDAENMPNSKLVWLTLSGLALLGVSLFKLSRCLSRIQQKLSRRGQMNGRIKRDLIMAKIPLASWAGWALLPIVLERLNAKTDDDTLLEPNGLDRHVELNSLQAFLTESGLMGAKLLWVAAVSLLFSVSGTYGACIGVGVGFVARLWRIVATLIAVPWESAWEWKLVSRRECFMSWRTQHLWADLVSEQRHSICMLLCSLLVFNFRWSVLQVARDAAALETKTQKKDGKLGEMCPAAKEGGNRELWEP